MNVDPRSANRAHWDAKAGLHGQDAYYDSRTLLAGGSSLTEVELDALQRVAPDLSGLRVCHMQCHIGLDSISLARLGAQVTALDFSPVALRKSAELARKCGVELVLIEADATNPPTDLSGCFDLVFASIGVLCWIGEVDRWMSAVHRLLVPGGHLVLVELHPLYLMVGSQDPLILDFPYCYQGPHIFDEDGSYADPSAHLESTVTVQYAHGIGEVVSAAIAAGLSIIHLGEQTHSPCDFRGDLGRSDSDGRYRLRLGGQPIPLLYTVLARRKF
jgi:SAM-dependent methyltransferase